MFVSFEPERDGPAIRTRWSRAFLPDSAQMLLINRVTPQIGRPMAKTNSRDVSSISQLEGVAADRSHNAGTTPLGGSPDGVAGSEEVGADGAG